MAEIRKGDLAICTGTCCTDIDVGLIVQAQKIVVDDFECEDCGKLYVGLSAIVSINGQELWKPLPWLRRIDPLTEPTDTSAVTHIARTFKERA